jgi:GMP synthase-like glutamine amidotransferase
MQKPLKILIIDTTRELGSIGSKNIVHWAVKMAPEGSEVLVRRAPEMDLPKDLNPDAVILSGSVTSCMETGEDWIAPYDDYVSHLIYSKTPLLGICYGHQAIARCLSKAAGLPASLRKAHDAEFGWTEIKIVADSRLLRGLEKNFVTFESHYEEVAEVPPGAFKFAETARCGVQGYEVQGKPVFGIQFHPEYSIDEGEASLASKLKRGVRKDWILNPGKGSKLYNENVGKVIFGNFFEIASGK